MESYLNEVSELFADINKAIEFIETNLQYFLPFKEEIKSKCNGFDVEKIADYANRMDEELNDFNLLKGEFEEANFNFGNSKTPENSIALEKANEAVISYHDIKNAALKNTKVKLQSVIDFYKERVYTVAGAPVASDLSGLSAQVYGAQTAPVDPYGYTVHYNPNPKKKGKKVLIGLGITGVLAALIMSLIALLYGKSTNKKVDVLIQQILENGFGIVQGDGENPELGNGNSDVSTPNSGSEDADLDVPEAAEDSFDPANEAEVRAVAKEFIKNFDNSELLFTEDDVVLTIQFLNGTLKDSNLDIITILDTIDNVIYGGMDVTSVPAENRFAGVTTDVAKSTPVNTSMLIAEASIAKDINTMFGEYRIAILNSTNEDERKRLCDEVFEKECRLLFGELEINGKKLNIVDLEHLPAPVYTIYAELHKLHALYVSINGDDYSITFNNVNNQGIDEPETHHAWIVNQITNNVRFIHLTREAGLVNTMNPDAVADAVIKGIMIDRELDPYYGVLLEQANGDEKELARLVKEWYKDKDMSYVGSYTPQNAALHNRVIVWENNCSPTNTKETSFTLKNDTKKAYKVTNDFHENKFGKVNTKGYTLALRRR